MPRFIKPALWTAGVLAAGLLAFWLLLALDIPYKSTAAPETTPVTSATTTPAPPPAALSAYVTEVRAGPDDHTAVLHVNLPTCAEAPVAQVEETGHRIEAEVRYRMPSGANCGVSPAGFPVKTAAPIGERPVYVNLGDSWGLVAGGWQRCDRIVGCFPPADHCSPVRIAPLEFGAEAEHPGTMRACDQNWLIHDLQRHGGEPARRVAYRWTGTGWSDFASAKGGGCGEILAAEPKFPTALCGNPAPPS
ncbi:hypothetical protein [Amycolatopsis sp. lyj-346]|uniref:hypothetical protein n=1 Tax=Amycolatopsis sp. lyj-346 TaxID=2789289 RepID=UPI00397E0F36